MLDYVMQPVCELLLWTPQCRLPRWWLEAVNPAQDLLKDANCENMDKFKKLIENADA